MYLKPITRNRNTLLCFFLGAVTLLHCSVASGSTVSPIEQSVVKKSTKYCTLSTITLSDGNIIDEAIINGPPTPPPGFEAERQAVSLPNADNAAGVNTLTVPAYNWVFGCSAVSGAMITGYYDRNGFPNMYTGPTNGGVMPLDNSSWPTWSDGYQTYPNCPLVASKNGVDGRTTRGSIDDYWVEYGSTAQDPYIINGWTQHAWGDAIGDYMKTSQSAYGNTDGSTYFFWDPNGGQLTCTEMETQTYNGQPISELDGTYGRKLFYEAKGYTVTDCYSQKTDNNGGGFTFAMYKAEIDAGNPVMLNLNGHTVVGVGYDDSTNTVYIHDTWDYNNHTMTWGGSYSGMELLEASIVHITSHDKQLTVTIGGNKKGTVAANGLTCSGDTCTGTYGADTSVTITATPSSGYFLNQWIGCDSVSGNNCTVEMTDNKSVTADFSLPPKISASPMSINFGSLKAGVNSSPKYVTIKNTAANGGGNLRLSSLSFSGTNASEFAWGNGCPTTLSRGSSCTVSVTATPFSTPFGTKTAVFEINSNDPKNHLVSVKLAAKTVPPVISVSPKSLNFGNITKGMTSAHKTIRIKNTGLSDLNITSVSIEGGGASPFAETNTCGTVVKGGSCSVDLTFTPSSIGTMSNTLDIDSNDPVKGTVKVTLSGKGK